MQLYLCLNWQKKKLKNKRSPKIDPLHTYISAFLGTMHNEDIKMEWMVKKW